MKKKRPKGSRIHPFSIAVFLYRNAFLLVIPLLQYLLFKPDSLWTMLIGGSVNLILALLIVIYIILKYYTTRLNFDGGIIDKRGIYFRSEKTIYQKGIGGIAVRKGAISSLFGAVFLSVYSGGKRLAFREHLSRKNFPVPKMKNTGKRKGVRFSLVATFDATSPLSGLLLVIPFLRKTAPIVGSGLSSGFYGGVGLWTQLVSQLLPPFVAYVSGFIAIGYLIAFVYELLKHINTTVSFDDEYVRVQRGFVFKTLIRYRLNEIPYVSEEQGIVCLIIGIRRIFISTHMGKKSGIQKELIRVKLGRMSIAENAVKPRRRSLLSFLILPTITFILLVAVLFYLQYVGRITILEILLSTAMPAVILWAMFRIEAFQYTFLCRSEKGIVAGAYRGLRIMKAEISEENVEYLRITRNPFQIISGSCNVKIYTRNMSTPITVKRLEYERIKTAIQKPHTA